MTSLIGKLVFDKILKETLDNKQGREDPYFEYVPTKKLASFSGKPRMKKQKKALPPGLSEEDQEILVKVKRRAYRLDMALGTCCGFKIGWGSVIGLFPAVGDVIDMMLACLVVRTASQAKLPNSVLIRMLFNIALDFVVGLIPIIGDLADIAYKANTRNALLLEDHLRARGRRNLRKSGLPPQPDPSLGEVEIEEGIIYTQPVSHPQPSYGVVGSSGRGHRDDDRGYSGSRREYDPESQRGSRNDRGGSKHGRDERGGSSRKEGKGRGHQRLPSQETGTTAASYR
ncbi:hypothetical protein FPQ18DRAFT_278813 [Pyronema domesticum]|uniref:Similar to Uncharacterized membrane protein YLR326W acc. no. Q06170 n=1 Tax=Pyronema omphalodes (strain CBS 100304) TaxID=1076935 RepID=U4KZX8_PYROM|nr:hypothetical protein FPQ18DRAFT_278813 [Pyronema domesticum]CCX08249.1 Similar to Uncharacterized membrane protein YLR326W; acc. no. Q06170 [Pyronema omphalodes CBS 100304]